MKRLRRDSYPGPSFLPPWYDEPKAVPVPSNGSYEDLVRDDETAPFNLTDKEISDTWEDSPCAG